MELEFLKDFDNRRATWDKFWRGELNRPIIHAIVPKKGCEPQPRPKWAAAWHTGHNELADQVLRWAESVEFLGDSLPWYTPSICMGQFPAMLGAEIQESVQSWGIDTKAVPFLKELDPFKINLDKNSQMWEKYIDLLETFKRKFSGRVIYGEIALEWNFDFLAEIRGTEQTLMDLYDNPDGVHAVMRRLMEINREITDELIHQCDMKTWGSITRHALYSTGITGVSQCDFGFNIGKEHFDEFVLPYLRLECEKLDDIEHHLDGSNNIKHLESICSIEKVKVVQWVEGAGESKNKDWSDLYRKINSLGRGLMQTCHISEAKDVWAAYSPCRRIVLYVYADTADEVNRVIDSFESSEA